MKKLLAMLVALVMALSCTAALAEEAAFELPQFSGLTIDATLDVDREAAAQLMDMFGLDEEKKGLANAVISLLDAVEEHTVLADGALEYTLSLNGSKALDLGAKFGEEGVTVLSSMFPSYVVKVSMQTIGNMIGQMLASVMSASEEGGNAAIMEKLTGYVGEFIQSSTSAVSFADPVEYNYDYEGHQFNYMSAINVDVEAITASVKDLIEKLKADEELKALLQKGSQFGVNVNLDDIDTSTIDASTVPAVEGGMYLYIDEEGNQSDETLVNVNVTPDGAESPATIVNVLSLGGQSTNIVVNMPENQSRIEANIENSENGTACRLDIEAAGMYVGLAGAVANSDVIDIDFDLYFLDADKPLVSAKGTISQEGTLTMNFDETGKTVFNVEDAMGEEGIGAASGLLMDVFGGLGGLISTINQAVPEMSGLTDMLGGLMMGGAAA